MWLLAAAPLPAANFYANITPVAVPWTNGIVPYEFTNSLTPAETNTYLNGLREWELAANVKFVPHTNQTHWILFTYNTNWIDNVSSSTNPQIVTVSSLSRAQVCHEMGHSFGFTHENIRPDATNYITALTNNISGVSSNIVFFTIDPSSVTNGNYDFESVMHLGWDFESTNATVATQTPKPPYFPRYQYRMGNYCLSPGDRAALRYLYGPPLVPLTNVVTNTADFGPGSLRAAMYYVADHPGSAITFNIPASDPGYSNGVFNIHLTGQLPTLAANNTVIDGSTQPGFTNKPLIVVDGSQIIPETATSDTFLIYSASNQVKNISFTGFNWNGLTLEYADATNNTISGCWFGVGSGGTNSAPNAFQGILVAAGASRNILGGSNVLSGNSQYGIFITDSNSTGNVVLGDCLGTDFTGSNALANGLSGVFIGNGSSGNIIGGTNNAARNILSGNMQYGVFITGSNTAGNVVLGNYLGTDVTGSNSVPNGNSVTNSFAGIGIFAGAHGNTIGGTNAPARNIISGNTNVGVNISGIGVTNNLVEGNYIGLNASGTAALTVQRYGIYLTAGAGGNTVGGAGTGARNVISGNQQYGVYILGPGTSNNFVLGNYLGTDVTGTNAVGNGSIGVGILYDGGANFIGTAGMGNLLSGNLNYGVAIIGASNNMVQGNYIGTDVSGKKALASGLQTNGIGAYGGSANNLIGGTGPGAGNVLSGNKQYGLYISDPGTASNVVQGNFIGTDVAGTNAIGNTGFGIGVWSGADGNFIGGTSVGAGNLISGNPGFSYGIAIGGANGNVVQGNLIGTDITGTNNLGNGFANVALESGSTGNVIGGTGAGAGNVIAFAASPGVVLYDASTMNNSIRGNSIFGNGNLGINFGNLGVIPNDVGDGDTGPNNYQNFPVITNAFGHAGSTIVLGKLNSATNSSFLIDVYRNLVEDFSGYGQGQFYVGTVSVTTDGSGNATFACTNSSGNYAGQYISTTASDTNGNTSEFSADLLASNLPAPSALFSGPFVWRTNGFIFNLTFATNFSYRIQAATNLATNPIPWIDLTNYNASNSSLTFTDRTATNYRMRFYRAVSP